MRDELVEGIAFLCRFYGWTWDECLSLPYAVFETMLDQAHRLAAAEKRDLLDVFHSKDPKWLQERLTAIIKHGVRQMPVSDEDAAAGWDRMGEIFGRRT